MLRTALPFGEPDTASADLASMEAFAPETPRSVQHLAEPSSGRQEIGIVDEGTATRTSRILRGGAPEESAENASHYETPSPFANHQPPQSVPHVSPSQERTLQPFPAGPAATIAALACNGNDIAGRQASFVVLRRMSDIQSTKRFLQNLFVICAMDEIEAADMPHPFRIGRRQREIGNDRVGKKNINVNRHGVLREQKDEPLGCRCNERSERSELSVA
jgi:hypothetical protein